MDTVARALSLKLTDQLGQTVVVDNRGGGGGSIGAELAAGCAARRLHADHDEHDRSDSSPAVQGALRHRARFRRGIAGHHASRTCRGQQRAADQVGGRAGRVRKSEPAKLNFASSGNGSLIHLTGELFKIATGTSLTHIPYKGIGAAYPDLIAGNIQLTFASIISAMPHIRAQRIRALAVTGARRAKAIPELPTVAETGVKGFAVSQLVRRASPGQHAARHRGQGARRNRQGAAAAGSRRAARRRRRGAGRQHAAGVRRPRARGAREVGEGDQADGHQGRVISLVVSR